MIHAGHFAALAASGWSGSLLLVGGTLAQCKGTAASVSGRGYTLDAVGIAEALWCWPIDGYDLVLIDATEHPTDGLDLCDHIKHSRPEQKVVLLVGHGGGRLPLRVNADAVFTGEPDSPDLVRAVNFLLRDHSSLVRI